MSTNRRDFLQSTGAGAAGLALTSLVTPAAAQAQGASGARRTRKMVVKADDVGFSNVCNIGTFETIENGVVTVADVMLDTPGAVDALERLRELPWISVAWHMHMWGAPVLDPKEVPSLVEKGGQFDGRFRLDLGQAEDVVFDEAMRELQAQLDRCIRILGRAPDAGGGGRGNSPWGRACKQVHDEYGIPYGFESEPATNEEYMKKIRAAQQAGEEWAKHYPSTPRPAREADERWASRKIVNVAGTTAYVDLLTDSVSEVEAKYDPVLFYTEDRAGILNYPDDVITRQSWHPGYVDYYVYRLGERGRRARAQQFVVGRVQDVAALCDVRLKSWIRENNIELVNYRDALYGTREYQNHLKVIGSDLCMIQTA
jgi:predicted glycoside hydrolase/deacetylase ChbG (UPF0249 family)